VSRALAFGIVLACTAAVRAAEPPADATAVRGTVESYLHGLKFNDVGSLRKAFDPEARLDFRKKDGTLGQGTQEQWYESLSKNAGREESGDLRIAALDVTRSAAAVKVIEVYPGSTDTDYLDLLELGDEWKIVSEIDVAEKR
jgi:putative lumazine-binding protein